jgi:hypothetical protein
MSELPGWTQISPGCWVPTSASTPPTEPEKQHEQKPKTREQMATTLAQAGIAVDTSFPTAADVTAERTRKQREHEQLLADRQQEREAQEEAAAKNDLESLLPIRHGRVDNRFLEILKGIWANNKDGSHNYRETLKARRQYLDEHQWRVEHGLPTTPEGA